MNRRIPAGTYGGVRGWGYELFRILLYSISVPRSCGNPVGVNPT